MTAPHPSSDVMLDAIAVLRADHARLAVLFDDYQRVSSDDAGGGQGGGSPADRSGLLVRISALLKAHSQVESELFYPALAGGAGGDVQAVSRALAEHAALDAQTEHLAGLHAHDADDAECDAAAQALISSARAHIAWEEQQLFPAARTAGVDLEALGSRIAVRRAALLGDQGAD